MQDVTGTRDVTYDLISVMYHALQAAEQCATYQQDARDEGQQDLARFFEEVIEQNRKLAEAAKHHLRNRLQESAGIATDEMVDRASKESFPASDAPSY